MRKLLLVFSLALLILIGAQCQNSNTDADKAAVKALVGRDSTWFNAKVYQDTTHDTTAFIADADTQIVWWRGAQTFHDPNVNVEVVGDSAYVDWTRAVATGDLNVLWRPRDDTSWTLWVKHALETSELRGIYQRTGTRDDSSRGWALKKISLVSGRSDSTNTVTIDSMRIKSPTNPDLVIRDPLNTFYPTDSLIRFTSAERCTIWLYTNVVDGDAFLHTSVGIWYIRAPFTNLGGGIYQGAFQMQILQFPRFAIFDLLDHRTLYTPDHGYDYNGWLLPYVIKNTK